MHYQETIAQLSPAVYERLKNALEIGKWPDGRLLSQAQRHACMEAVLNYQAVHLPPQEQAGYIAKPCETNKDARPSSYTSLSTTDDPPQVIHLKSLK